MQKDKVPVDTLMSACMQVAERIGRDQEALRERAADICGGGREGSRGLQGEGSALRVEPSKMVSAGAFLVS